MRVNYGSWVTQWVSMGVPLLCNRFGKGRPLSARFTRSWRWSVAVWGTRSLCWPRRRVSSSGCARRCWMPRLRCRFVSVRAGGGDSTASPAGRVRRGRGCHVSQQGSTHRSGPCCDVGMAQHVCVPATMLQPGWFSPLHFPWPGLAHLTPLLYVPQYTQFPGLNDCFDLCMPACRK